MRVTTDLRGILTGLTLAFPGRHQILLTLPAWLLTILSVLDHCSYVPSIIFTTSQMPCLIFLLFGVEHIWVACHDSQINISPRETLIVTEMIA